MSKDRTRRPDKMQPDWTTGLDDRIGRPDWKKTTGWGDCSSLFPPGYLLSGIQKIPSCCSEDSRPADDIFATFGASGHFDWLRVSLDTILRNQRKPSNDRVGQEFTTGLPIRGKRRFWPERC